jgi:hypothetical protein
MNLRRIRPRLTYANIASSLALFIALGGTSYALTLPSDSVGARQLRKGSVRSSELQDGGVRSADIHNGSIALRDLSPSTRSTLRGARGPAGRSGEPAVNYFVEADSGGGHSVGNAAIIHRGGNEYFVRFPGSVAGCALVAAPAAIPGGLTPEAPPGSTVVPAHDGDNVVVHTYIGPDKQPLPFALIAAC